MGCSQGLPQTSSRLQPRGRPEAPGHPRAAEAPPSGPVGCCLGWGPAGAPRLPGWAGRPDMLGSLGLRPHLPRPVDPLLALESGLTPGPGPSATCPQPRPGREPAWQPHSQWPAPCLLAQSVPSPSLHLHPGPGPGLQGPMPPAGRQVWSLAVNARSWGAGRPSPQGGGQQGRKLCGWRAAWGASAAARAGWGALTP